MGIETKLSVLGLSTAPNVIDDRASIGTLEIADNVVIDQPNLLEPRKGFERLLAYTGKAKRVFVAPVDGKDSLHIITATDEVFWYNETTRTWTTFNPEGYDKDWAIAANFPEVADYTLTDQGTLINSTVKPVTLVKDGKFVWAPTALAEWGFTFITVNLAWDRPKWMPAGHSVLYRFCRVTKLPDGTEVLSEPSNPFRYSTPTTGGPYATPVFRMNNTDTRLFRTAKYPTGSAPPVEYFRVPNATTTENDTAEALYTNPSQGGVEATYRGEFTAQSLETFKSTVFYGKTQAPEKRVHRFNPTPAWYQEQTNNWPAYNDTVKGVAGIRVIGRKAGAADIVIGAVGFTDTTTGWPRFYTASRGDPAPTPVALVPGLDLNSKWMSANQMIFWIDWLVRWRGFKVKDLNGYSDDTVGYFTIERERYPAGGYAKYQSNPLPDGYEIVFEAFPFDNQQGLKWWSGGKDQIPFIKSIKEDSDNQLTYSEPSQPLSVPVKNTILIGSGEILGMKALREALLVFCSDGIYRVTGTNPNYFVEKIDNSAILLAPKSLAVLDNQVLAYTTQGVVAVDSVGVKILSQQIADIFQANYTVHTDDAKRNGGRSRIFKEAFATTDDVLRRYYLSIPNTFSGGQMGVFVYSANTTAWTKWTLNAADGVSVGSKFVYLDPTYPLVYRQKKFYTNFDYSDQQQGMNNNGSQSRVQYKGAERSELLVPMGSYAQLKVGDGVERLGKTYQIINLRTQTDGGTSGSPAITTGRVMLDRFSDDFSAANNNTPWIFHKAVRTKIKYNPIMEANPGPLKQWIRGLAFFKDPMDGQGTVTIDTDTLRTAKTHTIGTGRDLHTGGQAKTEAIRFRGIRGGRLSLQLEIGTAFTKYELEGVSLTARSTGSERYRRRR